MALLEDAFTELARTFARDLLKAVRSASLEDLAELDGGRRSSGKTRAESEIDRVLAEMGTEYSLNDREMAILTKAVERASRTDISESLGVSENTLKSQARVLLRKLGESSLSDAAIVVLHRALRSR